MFLFVSFKNVKVITGLKTTKEKNWWSNLVSPLCLDVISDYMVLFCSPKFGWMSKIQTQQIGHCLWSRVIKGKLKTVSNLQENKEHITSWCLEYSVINWIYSLTCRAVKEVTPMPWGNFSTFWSDCSSANSRAAQSPCLSMLMSPLTVISCPSGKKISRSLNKC